MEPIGRNEDSEAEFEKALRGSSRSADDAGLCERLSCRLRTESYKSLQAVCTQPHKSIDSLSIDQWSRSKT